MTLQINDSAYIINDINVISFTNINGSINLNSGNIVINNNGTINLNGNIYVTGNATFTGGITTGGITTSWISSSNNVFTIRIPNYNIFGVNPSVYIAKLYIGSYAPGDYWYGYFSHYNSTNSINWNVSPIWRYGDITLTMTNNVYSGIPGYNDVTWTFTGNYPGGALGTSGGYWGSCWYRAFI